MTSFVRSFRWWVLTVVVACGAGLPAQDEFKFAHPEKFERATKTDDAGLIQWAEHDAKCPGCRGAGKLKCPTCESYPDEATKCPDCGRGKERQATCRACGGTGQFPDPLLKALCPGCQGVGSTICGWCPGSGLLRYGEDKKFTNCAACRGKGFSKCVVCNGQRFVDGASLKPSLKDANAAALTKAIASTDEALKALAGFTPAAKNSRKEAKELTRILGIAQAVHPALKKTPQVLDELMSMVAASSGYQGVEEREAAAMHRIKASAEYYLKHQKHILELAHKRAEANEKVQAANKGK